MKVKFELLTHHLILIYERAAEVFMVSVVNIDFWIAGKNQLFLHTHANFIIFIMMLLCLKPSSIYDK